MARQRITAEQLAQALHVSREFVSRRLRCITALDMNDLDAVADALGLSLEELVLPALRLRDELRFADDAPAADVDAPAAGARAATGGRRGGQTGVLAGSRAGARSAYRNKRD